MSNVSILVGILCFVFFFLENNVLAQKSIKKSCDIHIDTLTNNGKRIYKTQRLSSIPPKIDGDLNDDCWKEGSWSGDFLQHMPSEGALPSQKTLLKILYDDKNIYVAIKAYDNQPDKIDRQMGRRDDFVGDIVGVAFDSYYDHRTGFEFDLTAGGSKLDLLLQNSSWDTNWDAVWEGRVGSEDSAWTAEMKIPLSQLRYSNKEKQVWGLHSWRWINRNQEESNWNLIPRDNPGILHSIGELHGLIEIPKSRRIELLPYTVAKIKTYEKEEDNPFSTGMDKNITLGLNGKFGLSSDFTVDVAINPDFGQVEADPAVLNLSAYETFYDEKRPFFLEGKNITDFNFAGNKLFYSRRIGQSPHYSPDLDDNEYMENIENTSIISAVKLTGKTKNGLSVGVIESVTSEESAKVETSEGNDKITVEPMTNYFIGRIQKDINNGNTIIGGMFTSTNRFINNDYLNFMGNSANSGGIDFKHYWKNKSYYVDAKMVFSHVKGPEEAILELQNSSARYYQRPDAGYIDLDSNQTQLTGHGGEFEIGKRSNGKWRYNFNLNWCSPGLELNDIGFMNRADNVFQNFWLAYVVQEPAGRFREYSINSSVSNEFNFGGNYIGSSIRLNLYSKFQNKWKYNAGFIRQSKIMNARILRGGPSINIKGHYHLAGSFQSDGSKKVAYGFYYHTHLYDDKISSIQDFVPNFQFKITNSFKLSTNLSYSLLTNSMQYIDDDYDTEYFLAQLNQKTLGMTIRFDYAITPELTIQYYGNPYISVGEYSNYKLITNPDENEYNAMYHTFTPNEIYYNNQDNNYLLSHNDNNYTLDNPDFNFQQFRSNFVLRWEYKTGSTFYFVWTHSRSQYENVANTSLNDSMNELFDLYPENLFLVKLNFWLSI